MVRMLVVVAVVYALAACRGGETPEQIGVKVNDIGLQKTDVGPTPPDLPKRFIESESMLTADLLSTDEEETLRELAAGKGVEILGSDGQPVARIHTTEYLTHFGAIEASRPGKKDVVLYTYPNDDGGGTFRVVTPDEQVLVGIWDEAPPPSHFTEGKWDGKPALFYLQRDELVVRTPTGEPLTRLAAPSGMKFQQVHVGSVGGNLVLLASGNGYTPFHMVCVFNSQKRLVFQEFAEEHAFGLVEVSEHEFQVLARSRRWLYKGL